MGTVITKSASGGAWGGGGFHIIRPTFPSSLYSLKINGTPTTTCTTATNRMTLMPFLPNNDLNSFFVHINVTAASAGVTCKILVFSDSLGSPVNKLYESFDLNCATTGVKFTSCGVAFKKNTVYWVGTITSAAGPTLTQYSIDSMLPISENDTGGSTNWFLSTTSYSYSAVPAVVTSENFTPQTVNCPAVYISRYE